MPVWGLIMADSISGHFLGSNAVFFMFLERTMP